MLKRGLILGVVVVCLIAAQSDTVKRNRAELREGPGAWFPLKAELHAGTEIEILETTEEGWLKVRTGNLTGYVSQRATEGKAAEKDIFAQMGQQQTTTEIAQSGVSAAVKGFAEKFAKRLNGDPKFLTELYQYHLNARDFYTFRNSTYADMNLRRIQRKVKLPKIKKVPEFTFSEEGMGQGIAAKIASQGLYHNRPVQDYINKVGQLVVAASDAYDVGFKFFILDLDAVNAYACPGGIVFVTRGALQHMGSEAELAAFLGHEIAHVTRKHGMKEMEERKEMIMADNVFMGMDAPTNPDVAAVSQDLDDMALESYETIFSGRLKGYEEEADEMGLRYAARAGYNPRAMLTLLNRLTSGPNLSNNEHYTKSQNLLRVDRIERYLKDQRWPDDLLTHEQRFKEMQRLIR
ncbi:MAG: M48 family metalloprotease [Lentisphaeria bacterium]|nr:M48 family metalloprotease [Candidatus Neomarinimicrobiota bacterium]MCF7841733.1 M48 family metalloprotease [Lentisphaeria bacterium]